ncbi:MAG: HU family DNA-binding protein [Leptospirales bacterium]
MVEIAASLTPPESSLTKSELAKRLSHHFPGLTITESREIIDLFLNSMKECLKVGDTVEMRDFGVLRVRSRELERRSLWSRRKLFISSRVGF